MGMCNLNWREQLESLQEREVDEHFVAEQKQPVPDRAEGTACSQTEGRSSCFLDTWNTAGLRNSTHLLAVREGLPRV